MAVNWLLLAVAALAIIPYLMWGLTFLILYRRREALVKLSNPKYWWDNYFQNFMWLEIADSLQNQTEENDVDLEAAEGLDQLGAGGQLGALLGEGGEGGMLGDVAPLLQLAQQLDGADLDGLSMEEGAELASQASDVSGWD